MMNQEDQTFHKDAHYDTSEVIDLKLRKLYSDLRLLIIASVALNQFLAQVALPKEVTVPALTIAVLVPTLKSIVALFRF